MRPAVLCLALAACGSQARPPAPEHTPARRDPLVADPSVVWRALHLTGADYAAKLDALVVSDATRVEMARSLLLAGDFACEDVEEQEECGDVIRTMNPLRPDATFDDPCLRRALALWALQQLGPEDAAAIEPALLAMVAFDEVETELQDAALAFVPAEDDALRLRLMAVASVDRAEAQVSSLVDPTAVVHAATVLHLDEAVTRLLDEDPVRHHATLVAALTDEAIGADTRLALISGLADASDQATLEALASIADDSDDCNLAETAAESLAERGDRTHLPSRPRGADVGAHLRALCMLSEATVDREQRLRAWIGPRGLDDITHDSDDYYEEDPAVPEDSSDVDGNVTTERHRGLTITTTHLDAADVDVEQLAAAFTESAYLASWGCDAGKVCTSGSYQIGFTASGNSAVVSMLRKDSYSGCGC